MANPKRKQSKTRTAKRRTHDKAVAPTLAVCPNCGAWHVYHTVVLGMYTILYVESVVITEENWQSKKKLRFKLLSISMYGPKAI